MSRSKKDGRSKGAHRHGQQGRVGGQPGKDLWAARPKAGASHCPYSKLLCRRIERHAERQAVTEDSCLD